MVLSLLFSRLLNTLQAPTIRRPKLYELSAQIVEKAPHAKYLNLRPTSLTFPRRSAYPTLIPLPSSHPDPHNRDLASQTRNLTLLRHTTMSTPPSAVPLLNSWTLCQQSASSTASIPYECTSPRSARFKPRAYRTPGNVARCFLSRAPVMRCGLGCLVGLGDWSPLVYHLMGEIVGFL